MLPYSDLHDIFIASRSSSFVFITVFREIFMSTNDIENYRKGFEKRTSKIVSSKESAQDFLKKTGIYTPKGNLTKGYKISK